MEASTFLTEAYRAGIHFAAHGDTLTVRPAARLTSAQRTFIRQHKPELLRLLAGMSPVQDAPKADIPALAIRIATELRVPTAAVLGLLDADDRRDIERGDHAMMEAWRAAVRSLIHRGEWQQQPTLGPGEQSAPVACYECSHSKPTPSPALIDCAALVPSAAAVGPHRRWASDRHQCSSFVRAPR